jgi:predicted amidohydrolase YtcJ
MWLAVLVLLGCKSESIEPAEQVFQGGTIYLDASEAVDSIAVSGGVVLATGADVAPLVDATTEVIDLKGGVAFPGFTDAHVHGLPGSFVLERLLLLGVSSMDTLKKELGEYAVENPDEPWVIGYGWVSGMLNEPSGVALDEVVSDRPVLLVNSSGHAALVNSKAMELAGINADTPDPPGGEIVRDPVSGEPTGLLLEEALALVSEVAVSEYDDDTYAEGIRDTLQDFVASGLTGIAEIMASPGFDLARPWIYSELAEAGELPMRIHYYVPIFSVEDVAAAAEYHQLYDMDRVQFTGGKVWVDGSMGSGTSWVSEAHLDDPTNFGMHYFELEALTEVVREAETHLVPIKFHVNGDAAISLALDALEAVESERGGLENPYVFDHVVLPYEGNRQRMAALGVVASLQPIHGMTAALTDTATAWGTERLGYAYDSAAFVEAGVPIAMGTDWPVWPTTDVAVALWGALNISPEHALRIEDAVDGYTAGSARSVGRAADLGVLRPGYLADMVVFDRDLMSTPSAQLSDATVLRVYIAGEQVY